MLTRHYQLFSLSAVVVVLVRMCSGATAADAVIGSFCILNFAASIAFGFYESRAPKSTKSHLELEQLVLKAVKDLETEKQKIVSLQSAISVTKMNPNNPMRKF